MLAWITTLWICVFAFWGLDSLTGFHRAKRRPVRPSPPFVQMAKVSFRNECATILLFLPLFSPCTRDPLFSVSSISPLLDTFLFTACYIIGYDCVFFVGHRAMHIRTKYVGDFLLRIHDKHHASFADSGVSHHYMSFFDYLLETVFPVFVPILLLGYHESAFAALLIMGGYNGVVVHSGWDLPFLPDPNPHFAHHRKYCVNFGLGIFDVALGTYDVGKIT
jgi:sterol desaturase/sphingolipid hydroxylase (fatty acid hydroxylase superfamily)